MAELTPVQRGDRWRVQMSWSNYKPRFFGDFESEAQAARWIKEHKANKLMTAHLQLVGPSNETRPVRPRRRLPARPTNSAVGGRNDTFSGHFAAAL
jgi:hypothetical protein